MRATLRSAGLRGGSTRTRIRKRPTATPVHPNSQATGGAVNDAAGQAYGLGGRLNVPAMPRAGSEVGPHEFNRPFDGWGPAAVELLRAQICG